MNRADSTTLVRAVLGELSPEEERSHVARLTADPAYRAAHDDLLGLTGELRALELPSPNRELDHRVLAALRSRGHLQVQPRQFWRLAAPAVLAASIMLVLALQQDTPAEPTATVTLASWYPLSADPTTQP